MIQLLRYAFAGSLVLALLPLLSACSGGGDARTEITEVKDVQKSKVPPPKKMTTKERLGMVRRAGNAAPGMTDSSPLSTSASYMWELPEGWEDRGATSMRLANAGLAGQPEVECYFSTLAGDGGGLAENLNRWRKQMGLEPYTEDEIAALPRKSLLDQDALYTVMDGNYGGMGGQPALENWRMLGLTLIHEGTAYFVKMTGPADLLKEEEANFLAFSASIHDHSAHDHAHTEESGSMPTPVAEATAGELPAGHPPLGASSGDTALPDGHPAIPPNANSPVMLDNATPSSSKFSWSKPEGWMNTPDRPMREVTYTIAGAECYVALLGGMAGGIDANINRWVGQMGQAPLTEQEIKALPTITILGQQAPLVEVKGAFSGMQGGEVPNQMLLGAVCPLDNQTLFVKMTGPEEAVAAQAANFVAFCESIKQ